MKPEENSEFEKNMAQLVHLLKKVIKHLPGSQGGMPGKQMNWKESGINMNICFFSFLPMSSDDLDEWEELYDQYLLRDQSDEKTSDMSMELSPSDIDFLRTNGIEF